ncbi:MAG: hypothetical protein OXN92_13625 [Gammaproteobacteria bacterium]|nr:hypothetical protein [Gammaproteobacteria bacterium]
MTRSLGLGTVILLMGCSTAPVSFHGVAPPGKDDAYECAVAQLNILGYTIEDGNKDTGFVRGRKQTSGLGTQLLTGNAYHDILTATAFDNPGTGETNLRVVASRVADHDISILGGLSDEQPAEGVETIAPSDSGKADARVLLAGCGVNNVVGPTQDQEQFVLEGVV